MRTPNRERAAAMALAHLATVQDPSPTPATSADPAEVAAAGDGVDHVDAVPIDADPEASSLLPAMQLLVAMGTTWLASKLGESWLVTPERELRIARSLVRVTQKYAPAMDAWGVELELGLALGDYALAGLGPRMVEAAAAARTEGAPTS